MSQPTSLRLPADVRDRLERVALRTGERSATLARGPEVAEVIEVLTGLEASGEERIRQTAVWLSIHPSEVRVALTYYDAEQALLG